MSATKHDSFRLEVPLDASQIEDFKPDQSVKVVLKDSGGRLHADIVTFDPRGKASATFTIDGHPGSAQLAVGPADATDDELLAMQTIERRIPARQWGTAKELKVAPVLIPSYYWYWWPRWCRTFTVRGRVVCEDGSPVPAATVCAYDVDWWFIWSSTQLVGCATTDLTGAFEIKFRWCCGFWPWWWWKTRLWKLDPTLSERVGSVLSRAPDLTLGPIGGQQPSLEIFKDLVASQGVVTRRQLSVQDIGDLENVRASLVPKLPAAPELAALKLWPWWPWRPWTDCAPDLIFKVTQDCGKGPQVIVNETVNDTRWNVPTAIDVTLSANDKACCLNPCPNPPCDDNECLVIARVCGDLINTIGGNAGAPANPAGYLRSSHGAPPPSGYDFDRPFAGAVRIEKNSGDMLGVDYYEIEEFDGINWVALPPGGELDFQRQWLRVQPGPIFTSAAVDFKFVAIAGHRVVESREHFEATGGLSGWEVDRFWIGDRDVVVYLNTEAFPDGVHRFRVVGWKAGPGNTLIDRKVLPVCGDPKSENDLQLAFDSQAISVAGHDPSHLCGAGVHACTTEPDTNIVEVRIDGVKVDPCQVANPMGKGMLEVDFLVQDTGGHLGGYSLNAHYGLNGVVDLLSQGSSTVTAIGPGQTGWALFQDGNYGVALAQGAVAPHWSGGLYRLQIPVTAAFPIPCCYQLRLDAWKRTVVNCNHTFDHHNTTEYSIGVGVCPPKG